MSATKGLLLSVLIVATGVALTLAVEQLTASRTASQHRDQHNRALLDVLPAGSYDNQPLLHTLLPDSLELDNSRLLDGYLATLSGRPGAVLLRTQVSGYGGDIELLIAISSDGKLMGVKTLKQAETPSLGGHIADSGNPWLAALQGLSRSSTPDPAWALKKDSGQFDQMAGATITSRAVIRAVHDALRYFDEHRQQLLRAPAHD